MKVRSIISLALFVLAFPAASSCKQPQIHFANTSYDFGTVAMNQKVRHVFVFTNTGTDLLIVKEIKAG